MLHKLLYHLTAITSVSALLLGLSACADEDEQAPVAAPAPTTEEEGPPTSPKAQVRFKGPQRLQMELGRILGFASDEVCLELGQYDCFSVHNVALGGVDPFGVSLYSPMENSSATTPLAVERVILGGCIRRSVADLAASEPDGALIYRGLPIDGSGKLTDLKAQPVTDSIIIMYQRSLQRNPKDSELRHLRNLYSDIEQSGDSAAPAQDWAALSCFSVLSTVEFLFY